MFFIKQSLILHKFFLMNVILTGATGTLGSQLLFQLLSQDSIETIFLFVRKKNGKTALQRMTHLLESEVASTFVDPKIALNKIKVLDESSFFKPEEFLFKSAENYFIHSAGCVNLTTDSSQKAVLFEENFEVTKNIFNTFSNFISKFTYISTAFSIGNIGGFIDNDYHNKTPKYRNFYEESKHATEKFLLEQGQKLDVAIQILRPSVLGGNIFNKPTHFISKYMVYYLFGKFFYNSPFAEYSMRLTANFKTGLNIIPVDYVAKVIATVFTKNVAQLNIVHPKGTNIFVGMNKIIETVGFKNFSFVNTSNGGLLLEGKNRMEQIYYNTIGLHLNQYLISEPYEFDTTLLESIVPLPKYNDLDYLQATIQYAINNNFKGQGW